MENLKAKHFPKTPDTKLAQTNQKTKPSHTNITFIPKHTNPSENPDTKLAQTNKKKKPFAYQSHIQSQTHQPSTFFLIGNKYTNPLLARLNGKPNIFHQTQIPNWLKK